MWFVLLTWLIGFAQQAGEPTASSTSGSTTAAATSTAESTTETQAGTETSTGANTGVTTPAPSGTPSTVLSSHLGQESVEPSPTADEETTQTSSDPDSSAAVLEFSNLSFLVCAGTLMVLLA